MKKFLLAFLLYALPAFGQAIPFPGPGTPAATGGGGGSVPVFMGYGAQGTPGGGDFTLYGGGATLTVSGSNTYLIGFVSTRTSIANVPACTWNGTDMGAPIGTAVVSSVDAIFVFGMIAPASGTHQMQCTVGSPTTMLGFAILYTGVNQTTPYTGLVTDTSFPTDVTTITKAVSSATDQLVVGLGGIHYNADSVATSIAVADSETNRYADNAGPSNYPFVLILDVTGTSSKTVGWTWTNANGAGIVGLSLNHP